MEQIPLGMLQGTVRTWLLCLALPRQRLLLYNMERFVGVYFPPFVLVHFGTFGDIFYCLLNSPICLSLLSYICLRIKSFFFVSLSDGPHSDNRMANPPS